MIEEDFFTTHQATSAAFTASAKSRRAGTPFGVRFADFFERHLVYWVVPFLILAIWHFAVSSGLVPARVLPSPATIVRAAVRLTMSGALLTNITDSTIRALTGLAVGGSIGLALGLLNGMFARSEKYLDTTIQMFRTVPNLALVPLVILWFGIGDSARLFLIAIGVVFPLYINTFHGIRQVDMGLIEMGHAYGLSTWQLFKEIIFPGALPSILLGFRIALGVMWLTLIVAETLAVDSGIGFMAMQAREFMRADVMIFAVVLYAILGKLADALARQLERRLLQWQPQYQITAQVEANS